MAIEFDATQNAGILNDVDAASWSHTVTAGGANRILIVAVSLVDAASGDRDVTAVTYNGDALTFIREDDDGGLHRTELWYLVNPDPGGSLTVAVTLAGVNSGCAAGSISFTGVDQSTPVEADTGDAVTNSATLSTDITTIADKAWVVDVMTHGGPTANPTVGAGQTERWNLALFAARDGAASTEGPQTPSGTVTMSWSTGDDTSDWVHSVLSLKPVPEMDSWYRPVVQPEIPRPAMIPSG